MVAASVRYIVTVNQIMVDDPAGNPVELFERRG
jgi:hypothetical protein